jgi:hypothetical protein
VSGPYRFERLTGKSHWLLEECPDEVFQAGAGGSER